MLCRTSNPGAGEFQDLRTEGKPLWQIVAEKVSREWNANGNCMLVVGATYPEEMRAFVREIAPEITFLCARHVGVQGGDVEPLWFPRDWIAEGKGLMISASRFAIPSATILRLRRASFRDEINAGQRGGRHAA